ncbi:hypothetical protein [uncultured Gilvimarinus sp.]|uniref:hypothetical protein n=1 Tax=uncultured Gilvimarinus sp. TaxID=1689143 RepID=UPI0030DD8BF9
MKDDLNISPAYQHFLDFFTLTQLERLQGLDSSYFSSMTSEEKNKAFNYLKSNPNFTHHLENLRGLYLCDSEKAINLFKEELKKEPKRYPEQRDNDIIMHGRVFMSGYVCNYNPTKENINDLVSLDVRSSNEEVRSLKYQLIPSSPTTTEAINYLKETTIDEKSTLPAATSTSTLMAMYGLKFKMNDKNYLKIYRGLRSLEKKENLAALKRLESLKEPVLIV